MWSGLVLEKRKTQIYAKVWNTLIFGLETTPLPHFVCKGKFFPSGGTWVPPLLDKMSAHKVPPTLKWTIPTEKWPSSQMKNEATFYKMISRKKIQISKTTINIYVLLLKENWKIRGSFLVYLWFIWKSFSNLPAK